MTHVTVMMSHHDTFQEQENTVKRTAAPLGDREEGIFSHFTGRELETWRHGAGLMLPDATQQSCGGAKEP